MGTADNWQTKAEVALAAYTELDIYNPRRENWDNTWEQNSDNKNFVAQVDWELTTLENVTTTLFYFDPKTKSPVTMLELGSCRFKQNVVVCCPEGFYRRGNVDIFCKRYGIHQEPTLEDALFDCISRLRTYYGLKCEPFKYSVTAKVAEPLIEEL